MSQNDVHVEHVATMKAGGMVARKLLRPNPSSDSQTHSYFILALHVVGSVRLYFNVELIASGVTRAAGARAPAARAVHVQPGHCS